jgi:hypothetical protein
LLVEFRGFMRLVTAILLGALVGGCVTPSIPIPPPDPAKMDFHLTVVDQASTAVMTYPPTQSYCGGVAYIYNRDLGVGVIQDVNTDCSIGPTPAVAAALGNQLVFSVTNDQQTVSSCIVLREGAQDPTTYCGP